MCFFSHLDKSFKIQHGSFNGQYFLKKHKTQIFFFFLDEQNISILIFQARIKMKEGRDARDITRFSSQRSAPHENTPHL